MNRKKILAIIKREYVEHIRRKMFWVFTILMPLIWIGFIGISIYAEHHLGGKKTIAVVDLTDRYFAALRDDIGRSKDKDLIALVRKTPGPGGLEALRADLTAAVNAPPESRKIDGFLILEPDSLEKGTVDYWAASVSDIMFQQVLERHLNKAMLEARLQAEGLSPQVIAEVQKSVSLDAHGLNAKSTTGIWISYIFMFFLFITLMQYGMINLRSVIEEKSNRIVELIISSVRPTELMLGKILGIGLVGLTQYAIWGILAMNIAPISTALFTRLVPGGAAPTVPLPVIGYFVLYFLLGYFFFASIYTAIGAPFNSDQEAQQLAMFPTWLMALPMFFWWPIVNNPNSTFAVVLSLVPIMTPVVMFMRVTLAPVPGWQIALSIALMLASIAGMAWFAGKVYRVGILMYGKKPTIPEIWRWVRRGQAAAPAEPAPAAAEG